MLYTDEDEFYCQENEYSREFHDFSWRDFWHDEDEWYEAQDSAQHTWGKWID
tara:strand:- start:4747 stop:4902 length:156 start_codon:yes stop_codon:yes gene_type:complete